MIKYGRDKMETSYCSVYNVPVEVHFTISRTMKVEKIVSTLLTYKRLGIQVIYLSGFIKRLEECIEVLSKLSKEVSIFIEDSEVGTVLSNRVRKCLENA